MLWYPRQLDSTTEQNHHKTYPDCGETSLRNFFNLVFFKKGDLDLQGMEGFLARCGSSEEKGSTPPTHPGKLRELARYYETDRSLALHHSTKAHEDWSHLVSNLNTHGDPLWIVYGNKETHDLAGVGQENMLNLIAHLIPDPVLGALWPGDPVQRRQLPARKWKRLCELGSGELVILGRPCPYQLSAFRPGRQT